MESFTKVSAECYHVRTKCGWGWATFIVRDNGQVFIASDYGNWFYWWSHHGGPSIKHFLIDIGDDYLRGKLGGRRDHFNGEASLSEAKRIVLERRHRGSLDKAAARDAWDALAREVDEMGSAETFARSILDNAALRDQFDYGGLPIVMEDDPQLVAFVERLWPLFVAELRRELGMEVRA